MSFASTRRHNCLVRVQTVPRTAIPLTLGLAGAGWTVAVTRMSGMDMGPGSDLGSFSFFAVTWTAMMVAMMLPSALPAVVSFQRVAPRRSEISALMSVVFASSYVAVWTVVGFAAFAAYRGIRAADFGFLDWGRGGAYVAGAAVV